MNNSEVLEIDPDRDLDACADALVAALAAEPWNGAWPPAVARLRLGEILAAPGAVGLAAVRGRECIGFLVGYVENFHPRDRFQLAEMAVRPEHQRSGVGGTPVEVLSGRLAARNVDEVFLITSRGKHLKPSGDRSRSQSTEVEPSWSTDAPGDESVGSETRESWTPPWSQPDHPAPPACRHRRDTTAAVATW